MSLTRWAVISDYREENWPSMDLCAEMLVHNLQREYAEQADAAPIQPPFRRRVARLPLLGRHRWAFNADRLLNRHWDYPRYLQKHWRDFDLYHICDHSYAQLVHVLPAERTGVYCHDLDTFRCLLAPDAEPRSWWFKVMARRVLRGLQKAAVVFYSTSALRRRIEHHGLLDTSRLVHAPYGISPEFTPEPTEPDPVTEIDARLNGASFLLHIGSCIPRKRMDVLLDVFTAARSRCPGLRLMQIGGPWTPAQREQITRLGIADAVIQFQGLDRKTLAALYRRAALVLLPSEAEGFGLPVIEALACGSIVVASDIPVLREVGGDGVVYCPVADVPSWAEAVCRLLAHPASAPAQAVRLAQARQFSWAEHARIILEAYQRLR